MCAAKLSMRAVNLSMWSFASANRKTIWPIAPFTSAILTIIAVCASANSFCLAIISLCLAANSACFTANSLCLAVISLCLMVSTF